MSELLSGLCIGWCFFWALCAVNSHGNYESRQDIKDLLHERHTLYMIIIGLGLRFMLELISI